MKPYWSPIADNKNSPVSLVVHIFEHKCDALVRTEDHEQLHENDRNEKTVDDDVPKTLFQCTYKHTSAS